MRGKSSRNGVHRADAVVWEPVSPLSDDLFRLEIHLIHSVRPTPRRALERGQQEHRALRVREDRLRRRDVQIFQRDGDARGGQRAVRRVPEHLHGVVAHEEAVVQRAHAHEPRVGSRKRRRGARLPLRRRAERRRTRVAAAPRVRVFDVFIILDVQLCVVVVVVVVVVVQEDHLLLLRRRCLLLRVPHGVRVVLPARPRRVDVAEHRGAVLFRRPHAVSVLEERVFVSRDERPVRRVGVVAAPSEGRSVVQSDDIGVELKGVDACRD
eukprot:29261-Pelagococcus_subviridis.AAC.4